MAELKASSNVDHDMETPDEEQNQENIRCVHLFNCDNTYKLDVVEKLFKVVEKKLNFAFSIKSHYFALREMSQVCENIIPDQIKEDGVAVFVVHAHESRLSINEDNAGIGYAKIYRKLLQATGEKVLVVIGGDDNYKDSSEEQGSFLSRWARRKVSSQFSEEYLDGRKSFIFSWNKEHRPIHEEALLHYFDPDIKEKKFVAKKKTEVAVTQVVPKQEVKCGERRAVGVKRSGTDTEEDFSNKIRTGVQRDLQQTPEMEDAEAPLMELVPGPGEKQKEDEPMDESKEPFDDFEKITHADIPDPTTTQNQATGTSPSSLQERIAILYRNEHDMTTVNEVFGDGLTGMNIVTSKDPHAFKDVLLSPDSSVRSCIIVVESNNMKEKLLTKSNSTVYQDLLKIAIRKVAKKIVVILCNDEGGKISPREEEGITARIEELLGEKGLIFWWKRSTKTKRSVFSRSQSHPASAGSVEMPTKEELSTDAMRLINPEEFTLVLKTRLRRGRISYGESDVWLEGWKACEKMEDNLLREWQSTNIAELLIFREIKTGKERTFVIKDFETRMKSLEESIKGLLESFGLITSSGESVTGTSVTSVMDTTAVTSTSDTSVTGLANAGAQMISAGVSGLANAGAGVISTGVAGLANVGANVVGTGLSAIGSMLSSSESPSEAGTNISTGDYDLNLDTD